MTRGSDEEGPSAPGPDPSHLPPPIYNWMSLSGIALAVIGLTAAVFFLLIGLLAHGESAYAGVTFLPPLGLVVVGAVLILAGWLRERWRHRHGRYSSFLRRWVVDPIGMLRRAGATALVAGLAAGTFALLGAGACSVSLVRFTESNTFCGQVCHDVMSPEATVYAHSSHARIDCVQCHVGTGGDSYLRSKVNGLRQVWAVATGEIERPIPTPIRHRRRSEAMCGSCHTPDRFIGYKTVAHAYFLNGEEEDPLRLRMLVDVGGGEQSFVRGAGIHFHMMFERKIEYVARDPQRQEIVWMRVTQPDGSVEEYEDEDEPLTEEERESLPVHDMECVDCHSRPAHVFRSPVDSVNAALAGGELPSDLPYIKEGAVRALDGGYDTFAEAMSGIEENLRDFYEEEHPDEIDGDGTQALAASVATLRDIYRLTIFPEMRADWSAHPNNAGHRDSPGCFRCHNDTMVSKKDDEPLFTDCSRCHAILAQGNGSLKLTRDFEAGLDFVHPEDWETVEEFTLCSDCHTGGADLYD